MPAIRFTELPDHARVWVFASDRPLLGDDARALLDEVDAFLAQWKAHGAPLRSAREWRDDRFLAIGVDPDAEQASGCSIDGMFRGLRELEQRLGTTLVAGGRVFYRDAAGAPQLAPRKELPSLAKRGALTSDTAVFDTSVTSVRDWRSHFEVRARDTWLAATVAQASQRSSPAATNSSSARNG
ncbi:MAG TPA: hypothetical protein VEB19_06075 [Gemmatimonadaceae bacterium]|nr:hypothetical protein [Gemmatimonadaceae bacterium]